MLVLKQNLNAPSSLGWTDPDPCKWQHVTCSDDKRVTRIEIGHQNLTGFLSPGLAYLTALQSLDLTSNKLIRVLPNLARLSSLQNLSLSNNSFSYIPQHFFLGMTSLERVYLDNNPFMQAPIPVSLQTALNLKVFSANASNFSWKIPDFLGTFAGLTTLHLAFNNLEGELPATFSGSSIQSLRLNGQQGVCDCKLHGSIDVIQNMTRLIEVWLHSNSFSGPLPDLSGLTGLQSFSVRDNGFTGQVPASFVNLPSLKVVNLTNNLLQGPTPKFDSSVAVDMKIGNNSFCLSDPGVACDPLVNTFLSIVQSFGCPTVFAESWKGNNPCSAWFGLQCENGNIIVVNFTNLNLTGTISPNFLSIISLQILILSDNNLTGTIPKELTSLPSLKELDVSTNQLSGKIPSFKSNVVVNTNGNPNITKKVAISPTMPRIPSETSGSSGSRYSTRVIAGLVIGGVCVVLFVGIPIYYLYKGKQKHFGDLLC